MLELFLQISIEFRIFSLFLFGLVFGSFFNVVIYRLPIILQLKWKSECHDYLNIPDDKSVNVPEKFNLAYPKSHCVNCKSLVPWWSNIPILGYVLLRGRCHSCKMHISWRYPLVEILTGIVFGICAYFAFDLISLIGYLIFASFLICIALIDYDTYLLPDELSLFLLWIGLLFNLNGMISGSLFDSVLGVIIGYMLLWVTFWLYKLITKKDGMGYGDFKLLAAIGAWCGWGTLLPVVLISSFSGIIYAMILKLIGKFDGQKMIPFGPFLAIGGFIGIFYGKQLVYLIIH